MVKNIEIVFREKKSISVGGKRCGAVMIEGSKDNRAETDKAALVVECSENVGSGHSLVTVRYANGGFTFKPVEVLPGQPMYYAEEGVIVRAKGDRYDFRNISEALVRDEKGKQADYAEALRNTGGVQSCPTVLGVPRDIRMFELGFRKNPIEEKQHMDLYDYIVPHNNWYKANAPELGIEGITYRYLTGRGIGCKTNIKRRLSDGCLPVLTATVTDDDMEYRLTAFATLYEKDLSDSKGTPYLLADRYSAAAVFSPEQEAVIEKLSFQTKAPVLMVRVEAVNRASTPRLAFVRLPHINTGVMAECETVEGQVYDGKNGFGKVKDRVYLAAKLNGRVCSARETAVLVGAKKKCVYHWILFHTPVAESEAKLYDPSDFEKILKREKAFYRKRLDGIAQISVPEKRMNELWKASYLQMSQNCFGAEGEEVLAPAVGVYCAIASESENVVSALLSYGDFDYAKRCASYFFKKQRADGFIQNMKNYMPETGGALYLAGGVWRHTRDFIWLKSISEGVRKACEYLFAWIDRNSVDDGKNGYGMIDGQVADPVDNYRLYMLNAMAYGGLKRAAEMLSALGDGLAEETALRAKTLKERILSALKENLITAPLSPMKDGTFLPLLPPWAEADGAACLHLEGEIVTTHGTAALKDSLLSVPHLIRYGIVDPNSTLADIIVKSQKDVLLQKGAGFSQPYYNVIPFADLRRGNADDYVREFYYSLASLSDRETYSFWEHLFLATPHKTSEQGAFQARLRQMLAYEAEEENMLVVLRGVPDCWKNAKDNRIKVTNFSTMFGKLSLEYRNPSENQYELTIDFQAFDKDTRLRVYLPIRTGEKATEEFLDLNSGCHEIRWKTN